MGVMMEHQIREEALATGPALLTGRKDEGYGLRSILPDNGFSTA